MKLFKKLILTFIITSTIWISFGVENFPYDYKTSDASTPIWLETEIWAMIKYDVINDDESVLNKLLELFNLSNQWRYNYWNWTSKAVYYAKMIVNMLLSFVSFIALVMLIYAFYMMFFSKEDSGMTRAKQVIKWVSIALIIMWLSRFIVSMIFWVQSKSANPDTTNQWPSLIQTNAVMTNSANTSMMQ